ncbi:hypothetical protein ABZ702_09440 [Streptomyces cyaneofuscatus]|uniref:hypothetical protein n=1 Tax=Streptomyces cyaneofuscatus TaxID=66883 RepID=UPI0033C2AC9B
MANGTQRSAPVWHRLAQPNDHLRALLGGSVDRTRWVACGHSWDAVAISPMAVGLEALVAMRVGPRSGYPVLADHLRDQLYVLVPPGTGSAAAGLPGVRVLGAGFQLLMPTGEHGTLVAHWVSPPRGTPSPLVRPDRLAHHLRALTGAARREVAAS